MDEREFLAADLGGLIAAELTDEVAAGLPAVYSYLVQDPYGERWLGPTVAELFPMAGSGVTVGAGVIALLHALAGLAGRDPVYVLGDVYPDLPHWMVAAGGRCVSRFDFGNADDADHAGNVAACGARLVLIERPALTGPTMDLPRLRTFCASLPAGVAVLVDESYANYHPPAYSAVPLTADLPNLAVVRGLAKGYGLGGIRVGYCVSSAGLTDRVRALVPPMLAASLSLRLARAVLALGDVTGPLRARIAQVRAETLELFERAGIVGAQPAGEHIPFMFFDDEGDPGPTRLRAAGVLGKRHNYWSERRRTAAYRYRISLPLRAERMASLRARLTA
ncbi:aminotransferase class I/II-fold pyridoxal phosphate-dependent enzyme [Dactylosporangium sp. NPDC051484]|uniref:aminotransferase class I/II-fold pyridoxal phosphate-dependent enzyme n=1 Tax=Dactylosporangium sp. NPDC051484 TaxID=3154942 RepID=UPI00344CD633